VHPAAEGGFVGEAQLAGALEHVRHRRLHQVRDGLAREERSARTPLHPVAQRLDARGEHGLELGPLEDPPRIGGLVHGRRIPRDRRGARKR
jgi:hypothetical protein